MLSICKVALGREDYYLATTATGRDHSEGLVEAPGVWVGDGSHRLGLTGCAEPRAVRRLFAGVEPGSGEPLLDDAGRRRVVVYDCTFSTPKSVSILQALSPDPHVRAEMLLGHEAAVNAGLAYLETEAPAVRLRTPDGPRVVRGGELLGVGFLHRLSREGDPHLHTHLLIANLVLDPTGGPGRVLDATSLFLEIRTAGALYETHLRYELTRRLGVEWQPLHGRCWADMTGLDRPVIERLSRRSLQIAAGMQAEGWQGPAAMRAMADLTRPPKDTSRTYDEAIEICRLRLREGGVSDTRLRQICYRVPTAGPSGRQDDRDRWTEETLQRLGAASTGSFTTRDVIRARCAAAPEGRRADGVVQDALALLSDERVIARGEHRAWLRGGATGSVPVGRSEASYTTLDVVATEERIAVLAGAIVSERPGALLVAGYGPGERFVALDAVSVAAASWTADGRTVMAVAPGRRSAAGIESACGIDCVVSPLAPEHAEDLRVSRGSVVVLAEPQCYRPAVLEGFLRSCEAAEASVVLLGPRWALESRPALAGVRAAAAELREPSHGSPVPTRPTMAEHSFGDVVVTTVPSLAAARDEAARQLVAERQRARDAGAGAGGAIVVTADEAIAKALRAMPGLEANEIVRAADLKSLLAARAVVTQGSLGPPQLVVVGGACVLRQGATAAPGTHRSHVVVAPGIEPGSPAGLGLAAEAARPRYLTSSLGIPPASPADREAWRTAAVSIEQYRHRWQITDDRHAFGRSSAVIERSSDREAELAVVGQLAADVRGHSRGPAGRARDAPELGLGR